MKHVLVLLLASLAALPAAAAPLKVIAYETRPFLYSDGGKPAGLEYEILEYFARAKGQTLEVEFTSDFDQILPRIARGEADVAAATITITPERERQVDFSMAYFPVRVMLIEAQGQNTTRLDQLSGATLATMRGTTYQSLLQAVPNARFVYADSEEEQFRLVARGEARAAAVDSAVALTLRERYPRVRLGMPLSPEQGFGFAVREGSPLAAELSSHIQKLRSSQIYFRLLEKHLGKEAAALVAAGRNR